MTGAMPDRTPIPRRGRNSELVLDALSNAGRPMGAYDLLRALDGSGLRSPITIYRALNRLVRDGKVRRIDAIRAYTVCDGPLSSKVGGFLVSVCTDCGRASELQDAELERVIAKLSKRTGFVAAKAVELSGLCDACQHR